MKIKNIKISNILSFKYYEDLDECEVIKFSANKNRGAIHVLIGPNASGKSNFLEILNQIFKNILFKRCQFYKKMLIESIAPDSKNKKSILKIHNKNAMHLNKHWSHRDKQQQITLVLGLNENDYQNIEFLIDNSTKVDNYFRDYSNTSIEFSPLILDSINDFKQCIRRQSIELSIIRSEENGPFAIQLIDQSNANKFIQQYLEYFNFLQKIIEINNIENEDTPWTPLKNTFSLISCYRNYNLFSAHLKSLKLYYNPLKNLIDILCI